MIMSHSQDKARIAFLVSQYPAINLTIIMNEIRELRKAFVLRTASIRAPDRPVNQLAPEERDEASRTYYIKPQGIRGALPALIASLVTQPVSFFRGFFYALRLSGFRTKLALKTIAYFVQGLMVGQWMRREELTHLHTHYSSTVALLVQRTFRVELSISFHGPDEFRDPAAFWIRQKIEASTFVRAISEFAKSRLSEQCGSEHRKKIEVAYMGVDPGIFTPRPFRENPTPLEIICVGRLAPVKAQGTLISAVHEVVKTGRNVLLHVVGGGPDRAKLEDHAGKLGVKQHVIFYGFTPQDKLDELYRRADVFALASLAEGVPGVLMEAMAMEIPCVATPVAGVPELIRDGIDGLLVPPSDERAIGLAILRLVY